MSDFFFARLTLPTRFNEKAVWWSEQLNTDPGYDEAKEKQGFIPSAPAVRYEMRGWFRKHTSPFFTGALGSVKYLDDLRHELMGTTYGGPNASKGSKLFVSHLYKNNEGWEFRVWGWVPDLSAYDVKRDALIQDIEHELSSPDFSRKVFGLSKPLKMDWHSFDRRGQKSVTAYLTELVS